MTASAPPFNYEIDGAGPTYKITNAGGDIGTALSQDDALYLSRAGTYYADLRTLTLRVKALVDSIPAVMFSGGYGQKGIDLKTEADSISVAAQTLITALG